MTFAVGLSGFRGSGKSSVASLLAARYGFSVVSFGNTVRAEALNRGLGQSVEALQMLGNELMKEWGAAQFSARVLRGVPGDQDVVLDGIRHVDVLHALRELSAPRRFVSVFIDVADDERRRRLQQRDRDDGAKRDSHVVESEVDQLRELADVVLEDSSIDAVDRLFQCLQSIEPGWTPQSH